MTHLEKQRILQSEIWIVSLLLLFFFFSLTVMKVLRLKNSSLEPGPSSGLRWSPVGFVSVCIYGLSLLHSVAQPESSQCEHSEDPSMFLSFFFVLLQIKYNSHFARRKHLLPTYPNVPVSNFLVRLNKRLKTFLPFFNCHEQALTKGTNLSQKFVMLVCGV